MLAFSSPFVFEKLRPHGYSHYHKKGIIFLPLDSLDFLQKNQDVHNGHPEAKLLHQP